MPVERLLGADRRVEQARGRRQREEHRQHALPHAQRPPAAEPPMHGQAGGRDRFDVERRAPALVATEQQRLAPQLDHRERRRAALLDELGRRGAASVRSLVLLAKEGRAEVATRPDFIGFDIPDEFVVGYGLDFDGFWRHLPYLAVLDEDEIAATRAAQVAACPDADGRG